MMRPEDDASAAAAFDRLIQMLAPRSGRTDGVVAAVLAVSGGPDSLAMLALAGEQAERLRDGGLVLTVATVDHGLRPEADAEAAFVASVAAEYGFAHSTLRWRGWDGCGNLQAMAREARYRLLAQEATRRGACAVVTAHHEDDQIETHLLARMRGASGAGLAGMRQTRALVPGVTLVRPFLGVSMAGLRRVLRGREGVRDPSNDDGSFARVRLRKVLAATSIEDRSAYLKAIAAAQDRRACDDAAFLEAVWEDAADRMSLADDVGRLYRFHDRFRMLDQPLARRFVARAVTAAGGAAHPPPAAAAGRLAERLREAGPGFASTLNGCQVRLVGRRIMFAREYGRSGLPTVAVEPEVPRALFDNRLDIAIGRDFDDAGARLVAPFGRFWQGDELERTLPVIVNGEGEPVAAHQLVADKAGIPYRWLSAFSRVRWRFLADLHDGQGRPPAPMVAFLDPVEPGSAYHLVVVPPFRP